MTSVGEIYYIANSGEWRRIPGMLQQVTAGDLNGDGKSDLIGFTADGGIFCTEDLNSWRPVPPTP